MHCLLCYTAAQHLSVHSRRDGARETLHTQRTQKREREVKRWSWEKGVEESERERGPKK